MPVFRERKLIRAPSPSKAPAELMKFAAQIADAPAPFWLREVLQSREDPSAW
jgi:hypothetical protein